jgi:hypothetical protein
LGSAGESQLRKRTEAQVHRSFLWLLVVLNAVVLLGQLWPAGAPPFSRAVNIVFLVLALGYFVRAAIGRSPPHP